MPVDYQIDVDRRIVVNTATGHVTGDEFRNIQGLMLADPRFSATLAQILDLSAVTDHG